MAHTRAELYQQQQRKETQTTGGGLYKKGNGMIRINKLSTSKTENNNQHDYERPIKEVDTINYEDNIRNNG